MIIDIISRECLLVAFVCKVLIFAYENLDFNEEIMVLMANRLGMKRKFERCLVKMGRKWCKILFLH